MSGREREREREPRDAAAVLFGLKFANNIHYKFKSIAVVCECDVLRCPAVFRRTRSQVSKARLHSSKIPTKTEFSERCPFKVTCFGVIGKAIRN